MFWPGVAHSWVTMKVLFWLRRRKRNLSEYMQKWSIFEWLFFSRNFGLAHFHNVTLNVFCCELLPQRTTSEVFRDVLDFLMIWLCLCHVTSTISVVISNVRIWLWFLLETTVVFESAYIAFLRVWEILGQAWTCFISSYLFDFGFARSFFLFVLSPRGEPLQPVLESLAEHSCDSWASPAGQRDKSEDDFCLQFHLAENMYI